MATILDTFMIVFDKALQNVDCIWLYYLPKKLDNGFKLQIHSIFQYIAKFLSKCMKTKMALYPELGLLKTNSVIII